MSWQDDLASGWDTLNEPGWWWARLLVGLAATGVVTWLVRLVVFGPIKKIIAKSENTWDDELFELALPLFRFAVAIAGVYATLIWMASDLAWATRVEVWAGSLLVILLLFFVGRFLLRAIDTFVPKTVEGMQEKAGVDLSGGASFAMAIMKAAVWASAALIIMAQLNIDITAALASMTILTLVIGMTLSESASQLIAGLLLVVDKPFKEGDKIQVGMLTGVVVDIGLMSTKIRTASEHLVVFPNKTLQAQQITNFARGGPTDAPRRVNLRLNFGVGYDEDPSHVKRTLMEIANECEYIASDPEPSTLFMDMLDSSLMIRLNCWVKDYGDEWVARDWILTKALRRFGEEDIEIPYPHMQLKYDPQSTETAAEVKARKEEEEQRKKDKEERQEKAREEDDAASEQTLKDRTEWRARAEELRELLAGEETTEEDRITWADELLDIEERLGSNIDD